MIHSTLRCGIVFTEHQEGRPSVINLRNDITIMAILPEKDEQIIKTHAAMICAVVQAAQNPETKKALAPALNTAEKNGWHGLVAAIRKILEGSRDMSLFGPLDEDDRIIIMSILRGLQNPSTLPEPNQKHDPNHAAPGLAAMIHAAATGDASAVQGAAHTAQQMSAVGGDMARLGAIMRRLIDGERDTKILCKGMSQDAKNLVHNILSELAKLRIH